MTIKTEKGVIYLDGITAGKIMEALKQKHKDDILVPECKNGETWNATKLLKLDAWVMKKTYSPFTTIGYEIKVSRSDFERDQKWVDYLDLCHQFYFVCPAGLIRGTDLPEKVGLIWYTQGGKLYTKRAASWGAPDMKQLQALLIYVVMARVKLNEPEIITDYKQLSIDATRSIVEQARQRKELAGFVKGHIREIYQKASEIERSISLREARIKQFEDRLAQLGITWDSNNENWEHIRGVENEIEMLDTFIDRWTLGHLEELGSQITELVNNVKRSRELRAQKGGK